MYRLVIVAGPNRGSSFVLNEGENAIGRQTENQIVLSSAKVSKLHCILLLRDNEVFLRDEGSTNGTFVNGTLAKRQEIKPGDKVGIGDFVLELVRTHAVAQTGLPSGVNALSVQGNGMMSGGSMPPAYARPAFKPDDSLEVEAPKDIGEHAKFIFEGKLMPGLYGMLMKTEYRSIIAGIFAVLTVIAVLGSVMPMTDLSEKSVRREALLRAKVLAREVADRALPAIASHVESQIDLTILENEETVKLVAITDPDLHIVAPQSRLNQILAGGREAAFAIKMAKDFKEGREKGGGMLVDDHTAVFVEPIKTTDPKQIKSQVSAMSVVAIDFSSSLLESGGLGIAYGMGFVIAGIAALLAYFIVLRLSFKPFEVLNDDLDQVLRGELPKVTHEFKMEELDGLWGNINAAVQRISKGGSDHTSGGGAVIVQWDHEMAPVRAMCEAYGDGFIGFDRELITVATNPQFEEISGIHAAQVGQSLSQIARDQAFVSFVQDLYERAQTSPSHSSLDEFEFSGVLYTVVATAVGPVGQAGLAVVFKRKG